MAADGHYLNIMSSDWATDAYGNENGNENAAPTKEKPTLGGRGRGGPPPGIASSRETKLAKSDPTTTADDDDALADRFEKLKFSKR